MSNDVDLRSAKTEDLSAWDFAESFTAEEMLGLILGVSNHHLKTLQEKQPIYARIAAAFQVASQQIRSAYLDTDIPFDGDPNYEIPLSDPKHLNSILDQQARIQPTSQNVRVAASETVEDAKFSRQEIIRWLTAIQATSIYKFDLAPGCVDSGTVRNSKKSKTDELTGKERKTYLNIIGALLELIQTPRPGRDSAAAVITELEENYPEKQGIKKRTLEEVFGDANKCLRS